MRTIEHFINGSSVADGGRSSDVWNPSDGEVQAKVALGTAATLQRAVESLGNVTLIERPVRTIGLVSAARSALRGREIAYVADPLDALMLQVQGSGRLVFVDAQGRAVGAPVRVAFAAHNDQPYQSVGRWLVDDNGDLWFCAISGSPGTFRRPR